MARGSTHFKKKGKTIEIIPAVDIKNGQCVRLYQGDFGRVTVFPGTPVEFAQRWQSLGAPRLHIVDLDGAATGMPQNWFVIEQIVAMAKIPIQVGGGLRDLETIEKALDMGVQRVVLGTAVIEHPQVVEYACKAFGAAIVIGVDARDGMVSVKGWTSESKMSPEELVSRMASLGAKRFIYTDISKDGTLKGSNFEALANLKKVTDLPIIASGGVSSIEHLERLAALDVEGVIIGRAFYSGELDPEEVLARKW